MEKVKRSFISNLIGENSYEKYSGLAKTVVGIGSIILIALFAFSLFFHSGIINYLLKPATGTSLLFIAYVAACILLLDKRVEAEDTEKERLKEKKESPKPLKYKLTIVWCVVLLIIGISAIYFSNKYSNQYDFECSIFLVDHKANIYHLDWNTDCEEAEKAEELEEMYGYEIGNRYTFCEGCKEFEEDIETEGV